MRVSLKDAGPCRKTMRVEIPAERVQETYDRTVDAFRRDSQIPGFRKGRAPIDVVRKRFAKQIVEELRDRLIPLGYHEAILEQKLDVVGVLGVHDVSCEVGKPLEFAVTLDVPPEIKLPAYKGIKVEAQKIEVKEEQVAEAIDGIRDQLATFEDIAGRPVQKGDLVQVDYDGSIDGMPIERIAPAATGLGKRAGFWTLADENAFLPGFAAGLLGVQVGAKKDIQVDFDPKFVEPAVAGKKATYAVEVKAIREKHLPPLDADFLKQVGVESEDQLRARVRDDLQQASERQEAGRRKSAIIRHLIENTSCDLPETVVQQETRNVIYDIVREQSRRGLRQEEIEGARDEIFQAATRSAAERVKLRYILHRIAETEKIAIEDADVDARIGAMAAGYQVDPQTMKAELDKRNAMDNLREELRMQKTLDFLLAEAQAGV